VNDRASIDSADSPLRECHLALFLTRGTPLRAWDRTGMLVRETAIYKRMRPHLAGISLVTCGGEDELEYQSRVGDMQILYNRWGLDANSYSLLAPILHRSALRQATVYKTNQLDGAWTAFLAGILYRKPVIVRAGYLWADFLTQSGRRDWKTRLAHLLQRFVIAQARQVILTTDSMKRRIVERDGSRADKIAVVPNYVDTDLFRPMPEVRKVSKRICFVGRLEPQKNVAVLLSALRNLDAASLVLVGDGSERQALAATVQEHRLSVEFLGNLPHDQVPQVINSGEVFVLPSLFEGHPKALIEAMSCGAAVVGTNVDGIGDLIRHEETGLLCEPTASDLARILSRLLADSELRVRLGESARAFVKQQFSLDGVVARELEIVRDVISG